MSGLQTEIFLALASAIDAYVAANPIDVAYPGVGYTPGAAPYLRPWLLPAPATATDWMSGTNTPGIFQVDVFWPAGSGLIAALEVASAVAAAFVRGSRLISGDVTVRIDDPPYLAPPLQEPGWLQIPVSVRFRVFT